MYTVDLVAGFDLVVGAVGAATMCYLLYSETVVVAYPRFFRLTTFGLLIFALTGPALTYFRPALLHAAHGTAALFVCVGLFDLVAGELRREEEFAAMSMDAGLSESVESPEDD